MKKKLITLAKIIPFVLAILLLVVFISPRVKGAITARLIKAGLLKAPAPIAVAPDMILKSSLGKSLNLKDQKGKVVVINLWAPWCPQCIDEMPEVNDLSRRFKDDPNVLILPVDIDKDFSRSVPFMAKHHYELQVYNVADDMPPGFTGRGIPTTIIIDKTGKIVLRHEGTTDLSGKDFIEHLTALANQKEY